jgi:hypothetical protein
MSYVSDELVLQGADVRPRRFWMINDQSGTLTSPQVQPYLLFVLTAIDITQQSTISGEPITIAVMPAGVQFVVFTSTSSGAAAATWRGWLPMEVGEYLEVEAGISISASFNGITYPNNV